MGMARQLCLHLIMMLWVSKFTFLIHVNQLPLILAYMVAILLLNFLHTLGISA